ncbi:MAG: molybdopterin molybdotransferase MoeA [Clostridiales bacterium]|nr:molybdopterin molybdotransferase MoeA [Clostridiales bacterium]
MNVSIEEAQARLMEASVMLGIQKKKITDCLGDVLAEDVVAAAMQPPFPRSAMDGYALHAADVESANRDRPVRLPVRGTIYAGDSLPERLSRGKTVRIMTGAPIPQGADLVIPQEATDCGEQEVTFYESGKAGENCCPAGEDFRRGEILAEKGNPADPYTMAAAAAGGVREVCVRERIRAAVITTGNELVPVDEELPAGKIYNSSLVYFVSRLSELGCEVVSAVTVSDEEEEIAEAIRNAAVVADLILTTGGVSVGRRDCLPEVIRRLGATVLFRGLSIKPGMPTMAASFKERTILCLSGNPYSAIAMFEILYPAYEKKAQGRNRMRLGRSRGVMGNTFPKSSPSRRLVRGILKGNDVFVPEMQGNGQLLAGVGSNCLVDIPAGSGPVMQGEEVELFVLPGIIMMNTYDRGRER